MKLECPDCDAELEFIAGCWICPVCDAGLQDPDVTK